VKSPASMAAGSQEEHMDVAMVGLGRMGGNMARRLVRGGHHVVVWNRTFAKAQELESEGATAVPELRDVVAQLPQPRVIWLMLPYGQTTQDAIDELAPLLAEGDILIDGGNSPFKDDIRRAEALKPRGIRYLDAGTSGGVWGLQVGYCLMVGGDRSAFEHVEPILRTLAPPGHGYEYTGGHGSGHFVKMVHNGIEYGLMQAYAEGFELLEATEWDLDLAAIADLWNQGSVVRSWLLELAADAFKKDPGLEQISGYVEDTGEGRWTVEQAIEHGVPMPSIAMSLFMRFRSRQADTFSGKVLAALRNEFGGHAVVEKK
jgi:6-phosphogluconate dehydrogenase